jgi:SAM-dependent methyltransferase
MQPRELVNKLNVLSRGFQHSQILFCAVRHDVFSRLTTPATPEEVAAAHGWAPRGARMLLDGLVAIGLVQNKGGGRYVNTPDATLCLVPGSEYDQTHIILHHAYAYENYGRIDEAVSTGGPVKAESAGRTPEQLRAFILGMADLTKTTMEAMLDVLDLSERKRLLDVGAGPGAYSIALLRAYPAMTATLFDMQPVIAIAREQVALAAMEDRCTFVEGDLTRDSFGSGHDLILLSNIIHSFGPEDNAALVRKCYEALSPGGMLILKDFLLEPGRTGPAFGLVFALHMMLHTEQGDTYTEDEVAAWTQAAGFGPGRLVDLGYASRLWLVEKPGL